MLARSLVVCCAAASAAGAQVFPLAPDPSITATGTIEADPGCDEVFFHDERGTRLALDTYFDGTPMAVAGVGDTVRVTGSIFRGLCPNGCIPEVSCMLFVELDLLAVAPEILCVGDGSPVQCPCGSGGNWTNGLRVVWS